MKYLYYPGCSLEGTALEYDAGTRALLGAAGAEVVDLEDWTCCGATAARPVSRLLALALSARNLALAEAQGPGLDLLVPCSACYLNLKAAEEEVKSDPRTAAAVREILAQAGLGFKGLVRVRHLLDVLTRDMGPEHLLPRVKRPLKGLKVAPYYGCQCLRPYRVFDDPEAPVSMEGLIATAGAEVHQWTMGARCCGGSHMTTKPDIGIELVADILEAARGADALVSVCPMCQMNLEAYQERASAARGLDLGINVLYLPQLLGLALGLPGRDLRLDLNLSLDKHFLKQAA